MPRRLDLGGGRSAHGPKSEGWINIDIDPRCYPDICRDLARGLPFDDNSVDEVYMRNALEHLSQMDAVFCLREISRVLKPGATALIIVPLGVVPDISHQSFYATHTFDNLQEQRDIWGVRLAVKSKSILHHPAPWDYDELTVEVEKE